MSSFQLDEIIVCNSKLPSTYYFVFDGHQIPFTFPSCSARYCDNRVTHLRMVLSYTDEIYAELIMQELWLHVLWMLWYRSISAPRNTFRFKQLNDRSINWKSEISGRKLLVYDSWCSHCRDFMSTANSFNIAAIIYHCTIFNPIAASQGVVTFNYYFFVRPFI